MKGVSLGNFLISFYRAFSFALIELPIVSSLSLSLIPYQEEQKLVYGGLLLQDSAVLKDVLRVHDSTIHLVRTPSPPAMDNSSEGNLYLSG